LNKPHSGAAGLLGAFSSANFQDSFRRCGETAIKYRADAPIQKSTGARFQLTD
jgi:hypothetical protein